MVDFDAIPESAVFLLVAGGGTVLGHLAANWIRVSIGLTEVIPWEAGLAVGIVTGVLTASLLVHRQLPSLSAVIVASLLGVAMIQQFSGPIEAATGLDPFAGVFATFLFSGLAAVIAEPGVEALKGLE
ncbi:hypothetical protein [Halomicrococcus sp. NG-SE-24]|uniref:hypothetical protein n=1 Tax=Halomicrococcus sp. NG-SE-24 TaxID=3436928 RepID=UPI003D99D2D0